jgi:FkbM family methyltransferase
VWCGFSDNRREFGSQPADDSANLFDLVEAFCILRTAEARRRRRKKLRVAGRRILKSAGSSEQHMLNRMIDAAADLARRRLRRGSSTWKILARTWYAWRACWATCRDNRWMQRQWARRESEFNRLLGELSSRTHDFFVIQIGACDGLMSDPIHDWIKRCNWGILVEPQRLEFEKLKNTYRQEQDRLIFENVAICDRDGTCTLYRVKDGAHSADWERGFASLLPRFASDRFITETVPCITFETLLRRQRVSRVDLLQIDAEGYDFEILKGGGFPEASTRDDPLRAPSPHAEGQTCLPHLPGAARVPDSGNEVRLGVCAAAHTSRPGHQRARVAILNVLDILSTVTVQGDSGFGSSDATA